MAGAQVHTCPTTPSGAPDARGTHTAHVRMKTRRKRSPRDGGASTEPFLYLPSAALGHTAIGA
jgi:hypothetical protein